MKNDALLTKISLPEGSTIREVVDSLNESGRGVVLICNESGQLVGVITDADVRRGLAQGLSLDGSSLKIACLNPITVCVNARKADVFKKFKETKISALPIISQDKQVVDCSFLDQFQAKEYEQKIMCIMAGGFGKRMGALTENVPKPMLLVKGKPMIQHIIDRAVGEGFDKIFISTYYLKNKIREYFGDGDSFGIPIEYLEEPKPLGTGGSLSMIPVSEGPVIVTNTDVITNLGYSKLLEFHKLHNAHFTMAVRKHSIKHPFGVVKSDGLDFVGIEEKPVWSTNVNAGIYVLDSSQKSFVKSGESITMPEIIIRAQANGKKIVLFPLHEECIDLGTLAEYEGVR